MEKVASVLYETGRGVRMRGTMHIEDLPSGKQQITTQIPYNVNCTISNKNLRSC